MNPHLFCTQKSYVQSVKKDAPYECIEVKLGDVSVGRIFPRPLEMAAIKNALGYA